MKNKIAILTILTTSNILAADLTGVPGAPSKPTESIKAETQSKFSISPYVTVRTGEAPFEGDYDGGVGLEAALSLSESFAVTIHGNVENDMRGVFIDEAGASLKIYPFNIQALTPYLRVGYAYSFNSSDHFLVAGAGAKVTAYKSINLFADVNWYTDVDEINHNGHALVRIGGGISF